MTEFDMMIRLLDASWCMRREIVPCLVGPPGIGKTAAVMQHAKSHGAKVVKIVASRCIPSETVGMTMPDHKNRSMAIYNSMQLSSLRDGDILFLDELLEAEQFVLSTLLTVIESREMADGTPLPDIQIIAATNDTIPPEQLKGNIRQRFMFQRFEVDWDQTKNYIRDKTGFDLPDSLRSSISESGNDYNFLTPRSLTKLCLWIDSVPEDMVRETGRIINDMWNSMIGSTIVECRISRDSKTDTPAVQARKVVKEIVENIRQNYREDIYDDVPDNFDFDECTFTEMLEMLQGLPEWNDIEGVLSDKVVLEQDEQEDKITF